MKRYILHDHKDQGSSYRADSCWSYRDYNDAFSHITEHLEAYNDAQYEENMPTEIEIGDNTVDVCFPKYRIADFDDLDEWLNCIDDEQQENFKFWYEKLNGKLELKEIEGWLQNPEENGDISFDNGDNILSIVEYDTDDFEIDEDELISLYASEEINLNPEKISERFKKANVGCWVSNERAGQVSERKLKVFLVLEDTDSDWSTSETRFIDCFDDGYSFQ